MKNWDFRFRHSYLLRGHHNRVNALALTPQGNILASGGEDGRLLLWDTFGLDNKPFKSMLTQYDGPILTVAVDCKGQAYTVQVKQDAFYSMTYNPVKKVQLRSQKSVRYAPIQQIQKFLA